MKLLSSLIMLSIPLFSQSLSADELNAEVGWADVRNLGLPVSGIVKKVYVTAGSLIKPGDKLVSLDCGFYNAQLKQSQAIVRGLGPSVETALKEKELADELFARTVLSEVEHRQAELVYTETRSRHESAQAQSAQAKWNVSYCDLIADNHQIVLSVNISEGAMYNAESEQRLLLTVASQKAVTINGKLAAPLKHIYKKGEAVTVEVNGKNYDAKIDSVKFAAHNTVEVSAVVGIFDAGLIGDTTAKIFTK